MAAAITMHQGTDFHRLASDVLQCPTQPVDAAFGVVAVNHSAEISATVSSARRSRLGACDEVQTMDGLPSHSIPHSQYALSVPEEVQELIVCMLIASAVCLT
jgi:hypothetical protein